MILEPDYIAWLRQEAALIKSDGCTRALEIERDCCLEHDLAYFFGRVPRWAFIYHDWNLAPSTSRAAADRRFFDCNGLLHRYIAVRLGGWRAWRRHRKARP